MSLTFVVPGGRLWIASRGPSTIDQATSPTYMQDNRPHVLVLTTTLPSRPDDGTPSFVLDLSMALAAHHRVTILAPRMRSSQPISSPPGLNVVRFPYFPRNWEGLADQAIMPLLRTQHWRWIEALFLVLSFVRHAIKVATTDHVDAVHAHWIVPAGFVAFILKTLKGIPYLVTAHGADAFALNGFLATQIKRRVQRAASVVTPVSRDIGRRIGIPERDLVRVCVPMGVDIQGIHHSVGERTPQHGRLLFVGRLAAKKGIEVLLKAVSGIPTVRLDIVGDGPDGNRLNQIADDLGLAHRVQFLGRREKSEVFAAYGSAQALIVPSVVAPDGDRDGFPVVLAEGIAAGVPIIASRVGGIPEHIFHGSNGLLVEPNSATSLKAAILEIMDDPEGAERRANAARLEMVGSELDLKIVAEHYDRFIQETIGEH
jgi:glycosyltransferase involved in cell wall biosynthesis